MNRRCEQRITKPEVQLSYPWVEAALRADDPNAFLMSLGETEFAVLLAELDAMRLPVVATRAPGRQRRTGRLKQNKDQLTAPSDHRDDTAQ